MNKGWIKLHRKFLQWEWFDKPEMVQMFIFLLLDANHADKEWRGIDIKRGQLVTSLANISAKTNLSIRTIRTCIKRLKSTNEIAVRATNKYSIITICNYDDYQDKENESDKQNDKQTDNQTTSKRQTNDKQTTTNKNEKNNKNEKKIKEVLEKLDLNPEWKVLVSEWLQYKKERRESYKSERGIKAFVTKLKNLSGDNVAVAKKITEQSFANNWAGIFELKGGNNEKDRRDSEIREQQIIELAREAGMA